MEFSEIIGYAVSALGGGGIMSIINWRINKKKAGVELQASEVEVIAQTVRTVYEPIIEQQNKHIARLDEEVQKLRKEKEDMRISYEKRIDALQSQIVGITRSLGIRANNQIKDAKNKKNAENTDK